MNKDNVKSILKNETVRVIFEKVSGEKREMNCTLSESVIPPATKTDPMSQQKVRKLNEEVCSVWDTDNSGWRSFRWDKLISVNGEEFTNGTK